MPPGVVSRKIDISNGLVVEEGNGVRMYFHAGTEPDTNVDEQHILDPSKGLEGVF